MDLKERFLKYVAVDTQSDPASEDYPSTKKQFDLLGMLAEEMKSIGIQEVETDQYGYTTGTIPATPGCEDKPVIGFISHVDTSPDMPGHGIKPRVIENYDGGDIHLNETTVMKVSEFPELSFYKGHELIVTDGTTLLGADDKAGVAEIMTAAEYLITHPEIPHGPIRIGFTPDEEIGRGVDYFDVPKFGAKFAYTMDGGFEGELEYENFNAAGAKITVNGNNIHPGYAKDKMVNALHLVYEFDSLLPSWQRPEHTEGYDGFYHLTAVNGTVEKAACEYIIRDHSKEKFELKKKSFTDAINYLNGKYGDGTFVIEMKDQYFNMREMIEPHPEVIEKAVRAMECSDVVPVIRPIRGGTDGCRLSYMGLPCPNLFTGGMNFHGKYEYCSVNTMKKAVVTIVNLARLWAE